MSQPRNRKAFERARELRAAVELIVLENRCSCGRPPTAKSILADLPPDMKRDPRTIRTHVRAVLKKIAERPGNLSSD
jgi:hypothetical protein